MGQVLGLPEIAAKLAELRAAGRRVVFTNGCFDILHIGHVRYLSAAKQLGDVLIVAVNSDESVRRLKPSRPVVPDHERAEIVAALSMVDYVTIFSEDTPYETIALLRPDVLVKGGDWPKDRIVGSDLVSEVHSLPYTEGASTSAILARIIRGHSGDQAP